MAKALLFYATAAMICIAACSRTLQPPQTDGYVADTRQTIVFGRAVQHSKTAQETTESTLLEKGFFIRGWSSNGKTAFTDHTRWDSVRCCFRTVSDYYYPEGEGVTMNYDAVFPPESEITEDGTLSYELSVDDDVVASSRRDVDKSEVPVMLEFNHLLARLSVRTKPLVEGIAYQVERMLVSTPSNGEYSFSEKSWTALTGNKEIPLEEGSVISVFPGKTVLTVIWKTIREDIVTGEYCRSIDLHTEMGKHSIVGVILSDDQSAECSFGVEIIPWENNDKNVNFE